MTLLTFSANPEASRDGERRKMGEKVWGGAAREKDWKEAARKNGEGGVGRTAGRHKERWERERPVCKIGKSHERCRGLRGREW